MVNAPALVRSKYDVALTLGDAMTQFVVSLSAQRNARTTTVRAWTAEKSEDSLPRHLKPRHSIVRGSGRDPCSSAKPCGNRASRKNKSLRYPELAATSIAVPAAVVTGALRSSSVSIATLVLRVRSEA